MRKKAGVVGGDKGEDRRSSRLEAFALIEKDAIPVPRWEYIRISLHQEAYIVLRANFYDRSGGLRAEKWRGPTSLTR